MPRGVDPIPARQFGQRYSFVRHDAPSPDRPAFDIDGTINAALALSRLIRPHSTGFEWGLRVIDDREEERIRLVPIDTQNGYLAYVLIEPSGLARTSGRPTAAPPALGR